MEKYLINLNTLAIIPLSENRTRIIEKNINYEINSPIFNVINFNCLYYGSSFRGRCNSSSFLLGIKYKTPIIINESKNIILFPTTSFSNSECSWINYDNLKEYYSNNKSTILKFTNNKEITINVSGSIISNQILRSARLKTIILSKKK